MTIAPSPRQTASEQRDGPVRSLTLTHTACMGRRDHRAGIYVLVAWRRAEAGCTRRSGFFWQRLRWA